MSETSMIGECPRMTKACQEGRGIEEGCKIEIDLAAAQAKLSRFESAQMPEEPDIQWGRTCAYSEQYVNVFDYHALRTFATTQTVRAEEMRALLVDAHECMQAFTDPEGDMPADTGEFRDLKRVMLLIDAALKEPKV